MKPLRLAAAAGAATGILAAAWAAWADEPKAHIQGVADNRLRQEIERAVGTAKNPPQSRFEARRRAAAAADDVASVLRSEGYYEAVVEPDVGEGDQPQSVVRVTPGPRFAFADPKVSWVGDPPVTVAQLAGKSAIGLTIGAPGRAADVLNAEGRVVAAVEKRGYADAKVQPREVTVDHIPRTVQPTFRIDAGALVRMDGIKLNSQGRTHAAWVNSLPPWKPGDAYDPDQVAQLEKRLRDTSVFDSVTVALDPKPDADGRRPVDVTLVDRPKSTLELGASYSTAEGTGVDAKWVRYNTFGRGDTLTYSAQAADILSQAGVELDLPNWLNAQRTLKLSTSIYRDNTNAYLENGARIGADLEQRFGRNDFFTYGVTLVGSRDDEPQVINGVLVKKARPLETIIGSTSLTFDHSDDILNPRRGWRLALTAEPTASFGSGPIAYLRAQMQTSAYVPLQTDGATVLAARLRIGDIFNGSIPAIPASRRFYSGGGGSVRGYSYQGVGPRFPDNSPQGGISLIETSFEVRQKITGPFGAVAFVDSGVLGSQQ
ncbi:MAG: surface antigen, partial [Caulobacteraceae bacterium]|nr:surface antigen [Caulobacteraceae bacterium]